MKSKIINYLYTTSIRRVFLLIVIAIITIICTCSCNFDFELDKTHGKPKYKVTLLNNFGQAIDTRLAHEMYESCDWGVHKNYTFIYYWFAPSKISNKIGVIHRDDWEWSKSNVIIERLH